MPTAYWPVDAPGGNRKQEKKKKKRHQENKQLSLVSQVVWQTSIFGVIKLNLKGCLLIFTTTLCADGVTG